MIEITKVNVYPFKDTPELGHIRGMAMVELGGALTIRGLRIMDGLNGLFVGYPNDPFYRGADVRAIVSPTDEPAGKALREAIEHAVLDKYTRYMEADNG